MSGLDLTLDPERQPRRFEVINGAGGRRHWSVDDKARIIEETLEPNAIVSEVARRYGLRPQHVFAWRREARKQAASAKQDSPAFVPAVVTSPTPEIAPKRPARPRKRKAARDAGVGARAGLEKVTPHVLHHTFASIAASLGFTELTISGLLGHGPRGVTQRCVHLDAALVIAADQVSAEIARLFDGGELLSMKQVKRLRHAETAGAFSEARVSSLSR